MSKYTILFNPLSGNGRGAANAQSLKDILKDADVEYVDVTTVKDMPAFLAALSPEVTPVLAGGDGTLNHFINALDGTAPARDVLYYPTGSGNDFMIDAGKKKEDGPFLLNPYLNDLPVVFVNGKTAYFINGIGYGIDGYCCEEGDKIRATSDKPVNYTSIAIKGLLFFYHRTKAEVTVDGVTQSYKHVWLSPTMNGRFYGGGMMCAPQQNRLNAAHTVSSMTMCGLSKFKTLIVFPSIFKGEHVKHTEMITIRQGHDVTVKFDRPTALQIDGETVLNVTEYTIATVCSPKHPKYQGAAEAEKVSV